MKLFLKPLFLFCLLLFTLHQLLQWHFKILLPWPDAYLDNLVVMPIVLTLWLAERRWLFKKGNDYRLSVAEITVATLYILLVTELLFPLLSDRFTADAWDVLYTVVGSILFYLTERNSSTHPGQIREP